MSGRSASRKSLTTEEVERHTSAEDLYVIVHDRVYDITNFLEEHPGGTDVLLDLGGQDATKAFEEVDHSADAREMLSGLQVGVLHRYEKETNRSRLGESPYSGLVKQPRPSGHLNGYSYIGFVVILIGASVAGLVYSSTRY